MLNILKSEFYKLLKDKQTVLVLLIYVVMSTPIYFMEKFKTSNIMSAIDISTVDFATMYLVIALLGISVFTIDLSENTMKYILPYYPRKLLFNTKVLAVFIIIVTCLTCFFTVALTISGFLSTETITMVVLKNTFARYITYLATILFFVSVIIYFSNFFKQRAIMNILVLMVLLVTRFLPVVRGVMLYQFLSEQWMWGRDINVVYVVIMLTSCSLFYWLNYIRFCRSEF